MMKILKVKVFYKAFYFKGTCQTDEEIANAVDSIAVQSEEQRDYVIGDDDELIVSFIGNIFVF